MVRLVNNLVGMALVSIRFYIINRETLVPGVFLLWWGLAAIVTAGVMALVPSLSLTVLAVFLCDFSDYSLVALVEIST